MPEQQIEATVHLLCGLPGAGKTTLAHKMAAKHEAIRFTLDEWLADLYDYPIFDEKRAEYAARCRERIWETAVQALTLGNDVVLDWSLWNRQQRADMLTKINAIGADHVLYYLNVPLPELRRRLTSHLEEQPGPAPQIQLNALERFAPIFEPPSEDEGLNLIEIDWAPENPIYNAHLEGGSFLWEAGKTGVLLLHGLTATTAEVRLLAKNLYAAGYTVSAPLLPGHGTKPEDLNETTWHDWAWEAETSYQHLATICDRVVVGGESTGGALALHLAAQHPEIAGVLCYAPAIKLAIPLQNMIRLYVAAPLIPALPKPNVSGNAYWQGYKVNPLRAVMELIRLGREVRRELPQITQPVLVMQGRNDQTVSSDVGEIILEGAASEVKELHWWEQSGHVIILEDELAGITAVTLQFIKRLETGD